MSEQERLRRTDPARTEPIRDWSNLYRKSDSWRADSPPDAGKEQAPSPIESLEGAINRGVEVGYRVIDEHIRRGQAAAQQSNPRAPDSAGRTDNSQIRQDDIQKLLERIFQSFSDLVPFWMELLNTLASSGLSRATAAARQRGPSNGAQTTSVHGAQPANISIEVTSVRPARVTLDLRPEARLTALAIHGLRAIDPLKPALNDVAFVPGYSEGCGCVRIRVPENQPPDTYTGVVVDRDSGEPRGTLTVRIGG